MTHTDSNIKLPTKRATLAALRRTLRAHARTTGRIIMITGPAVDLLGPTTTDVAVARAAIGSGTGVIARRREYSILRDQRAAIERRVQAILQQHRDAVHASAARAVLAWYRALPAAERHAEDERRARADLAERIATTYREPANGRLDVTMTTGYASVSTTVAEEWHSYGRQGYRRRICGATVTVRAPAGLARIPAAVRTVDGLVTLAATPIPAEDGDPEGVVLYEAVWIVQSRGFDLRVEHGVIALHEATGTAVHGASKCTAIAAL